MEIDFVVTWVDGNDLTWIKEKHRYESDEKNIGNSINRYRDWGLLQYWFRMVEQNAPWVNKIYFVTCGQIPSWLNTDNKKLVCISHSDFMPHDALPTFNSNAIEMSIYKIKDLSENFVLFNDDTYLTSLTTPEDFFVNGIPCDEALFDNLISWNYKDVFPHTMINNMAIINKYFDKRKVLNKYGKMFLSTKYGVKALTRNILLWNFKYFTGFRDLHLPSSHLKSTFREIEELEPDLINKTIHSRFRSNEDITHHLVKNWRICKGNFIPRRSNWGEYKELGVDNNIEDLVVNHRCKTLCINDSDETIDFFKMKEEFNKIFEKAYPNKSRFEKE